MSEKSPQTPCHESTYCAEDFLVRIYQQPARVRALAVLEAASGTSSLASLVSSVQSGLSSKTLQAQQTVGSMPSEETWKGKVMQRYRSHLQQLMLDLLIFVKESSSLGTARWTTPKSTASGPDYARSGRKRSGGDDLVTQVAKWPTPTASLYGTSQNEGQVPHQRPSAGTPSLWTIARRWPTPDANMGSGGRMTDPEKVTPTGRDLETGRKRQITLGDAVRRHRRWPTPTAGDSKSSGSRNLPGSKAHPGVSLTDMALHGNSSTPRRWPTPKHRDFKSAAGPAGMKRDNPDLNVVAAKWPTPTSSEAGNTSRGGDRKDELLLGGLSSGHHRPETCSHGGKCRPTLSPQFVLWLMGFPRGWLD